MDGRMISKQVDRDHYAFEKYMSLRRWSSVWHQQNEVMRLKPKKVLEVGPGLGVFKACLSCYGVYVQTLDVDEELRPDIVGAANSVPLPDRAVDVACAFQVLEHMPFEKSLEAMAELARVAERGVVISLPNAKKRWPYSFYLPKIGDVSLLVAPPLQRQKGYVSGGEHYWEIGWKGYGEEFVRKSFEKASGLNCTRNLRNRANPYHHFFVFESLVSD